MLSLLLSHKKIFFTDFSIQGKSVKIHKIDELSLSCDIFEDQNILEAATNIKIFIKQKKFSKGKCFFSVSHHDIVCKELILPLVSRREVEKIIVNEIEKVSRFAENNYAYCYQLIEYPFDQNIKVIYYVFQKSILDTAEKLLRKSGFSPISFDLAPINLLNIPLENSDEKAIVYIEDESCHLLISKQRQCQANYLLHSGRSRLVDESSWGSFAQDIKTLFRVYEDEAASEIKYVEFCGEYPENENFLESMERLLGRECSFLKINKKYVRASKKVDVNQLNRSFVPMVGDMLRGAGSINYFNVSSIWNYANTSSYIKSFILRSLFLSLVILTTAFFVLSPKMNSVSKLNKEKKTVNKEYKIIKGSIQKLEQKKSVVEDLKESILSQAQVVVQLKKNSWVGLLSAIQASLHEDVWIDSIYLEKNGKIRIKGSVLNLDSLGGFIRNLKTDKNFRNVNLQSSREKKYAGEMIYEFFIELKFKEVDA